MSPETWCGFDMKSEMLEQVSTQKVSPETWCGVDIRSEHVFE